MIAYGIGLAHGAKKAIRECVDLGLIMLDRFNISFTLRDAPSANYTSEYVASRFDEVKKKINNGDLILQS